jgi:hypothetical protein
MKEWPALPLALAAALAVVPLPAIAAGVNLSWDACTAEGGVQNKVFACNTNAGSRAIYGSFVLATNQPNFVGVEITVDFHAQADSLPAWWQFFNAGSCRASALSVNFVFSDDPRISCTDPWNDQATGGIGSYFTWWTTPQIPSGNANEARLRIAAAVPSTGPLQLTADTEYYGFKLLVSSTKTVGTGSCTGCSTPICITLSELNAVQSNNNNQDLTQAVVANLVTWQSAESCPAGNAAGNVTWGQVRALLH